MAERDPEPIGPTVDQLVEDALRPLFGENLGAYHAEAERYDAEIRDLQERARQVARELICNALDRLTFFGGDRAEFIGEAHQNTAAQRADLDRELHEALVGARERFNRRVGLLKVTGDEHQNE